MKFVVDLCSTACIGFCLLAALTLVLMHLPGSPLKTIALRASGVLFAVTAAPIYVISPIDLIPEAVFGPIGVFDDIAVVIAAICYVKYALTTPLNANDDQSENTEPRQLTGHAPGGTDNPKPQA